ncbi:MAG: TadE/TadG family type IV pilus assembly protein [Pseudomonadota bacterium]
MFMKMLKNRIAEQRKKIPFLKNKEGVAAVEFALIVPILLLLFIGTLEISLAVAVDRKVSRISSSVADLITQGDSFNKAGLDQLTDIANRIMRPYDDVVKISVVAVDIDSNGVAKVAWSYARNGGDKPAPGTLFTVPASIRTDDTFLISSTVGTDHAPAFSFLSFDGSTLKFDDAAIELSEQMFLRPRKGDDIDCSDC